METGFFLGEAESVAKVKVKKKKKNQRPRQTYSKREINILILSTIDNVERQQGNNMDLLRSAAH